MREDQSDRNSVSLATPGAAALFSAEWTQPGGGNTLVIRDGLWWGWRTIGPGGNDFWGGGDDASVPEPGTLVAIVAFAAAATRKGRTKR